MLKVRRAERADAELLARLIATANLDVAQQFALTRDNAPKHPAYCTADWLAADFARGERYFLASADGAVLAGPEAEIPAFDGYAACVATEYPGGGVAYLNRLAVLPAYRRRGVGEWLVEYVVQLARDRGDVSSVSIGIIGEHVGLMAWYQRLGFVPGEVKRFAHLPFSVRMMARRVGA